MGTVANMKSLAGSGTNPPYPISLVSGDTSIVVPENASDVLLTASATVTITSLKAGRVREGRTLRLYGQTGTSAITLTNTNAGTTEGQLDIGGANVAIGARDVITLRQRSDGAWDDISGAAGELSATELGYLDGTSSGTAVASKAVVLDASKIISGMKFPAVTITAATAGASTNAITAAGGFQHVTVTSTSPNHIVKLPAPTAGAFIVLTNGATGYELRAHDESTSINGGSGASAESAIPASACILCIGKTTSSWAAIKITGVTIAAVEAAA